MGLIHPADVDAWERWSVRRRPLRRAVVAARRRTRGSAPAPDAFVLASASEAPRVLAALDVARGTSVDAVVAPALRDVAGAILVRGALPAGLVPDSWTVRCLPSLDDLPPSIAWVLSAGSYRAVSLPLHAWAERRGVRFGVVQHGALTPFAPPLPEGSYVFAWSDADLAFWRSQRSDVEGVAVGSQLLWAASRRSTSVVQDDRPVWLGQLHGTELSRPLVASTSYAFCRSQNAGYRPHPGETDATSRLIHAAWSQAGLRFETSGAPLPDLGRPVVSIFSSGILESAAQGLPAWRYCPRPPSWLPEFWDRYSMRAWGGAEPTTVAVPEREPAEAIARSLA